MKIIVSDIDGTLIKDKKIDSDIRCQMNNFRKQNIFILATGRSKESVRRAVKKYGLNFFDYAVCSNGSCIIDRKYTVLYMNYFPDEEVQLFFEKFKDILRGNVIIAKNQGEFEGGLNRLLNIEAKNTCGITLELSDLTSETFKKIIEYCSLYYWGYEINGNYIDLCPCKTSKYYGFKTLTKLKSLECPKEDVYFIGDDLNDMEMLSKTENSFTFSNSPLAVKRISKHILNDYLEIFDFL